MLKPLKSNHHDHNAKTSQMWTYKNEFKEEIEENSVIYNAKNGKEKKKLYLAS